MNKIKLLLLSSAISLNCHASIFPSYLTNPIPKYSSKYECPISISCRFHSIECTGFTAPFHFYQENYSYEEGVYNFFRASISVEYKKVTCDYLLDHNGISLVIVTDKLYPDRNQAGNNWYQSYPTSCASSDTSKCSMLFE